MSWSKPLLFGFLAAVLLAAGFALDYTVRIPKPQTKTVSSGIHLSESEVGTHDKPTDCWVIIGATVVDVTAYLDRHPGGVGTLKAYCGKDATSAFLNQGGVGTHSGQANQQLQYLTLGRLGSTIDVQTPKNVADFVRQHPQLFSEGEE